jgi:hypothetical protein
MKKREKIVGKIRFFFEFLQSVNTLETDLFDHKHFQPPLEFFLEKKMMMIFWCININTNSSTSLSCSTASPSFSASFWSELQLCPVMHRGNSHSKHRVLGEIFNYGFEPAIFCSPVRQCRIEKEFFLS